MDGKRAAAGMTKKRGRRLPRMTEILITLAVLLILGAGCLLTSIEVHDVDAKHISVEDNHDQNCH